MAASECLVGVFTKAPRPGEVKTRLIPLLGPEGASALYRRLVEHTLSTARAAAIGPIELWCTPTIDDSDLRQVAALEGASLLDQGDGTLGDRMARAFQASLLRAPRCVLIGADCPSLSVPDLRAAAAALANRDAVLGPAEDGGYFLIGLKRSPGVQIEKLFADIAWGSEAVLAATRQRLTQLSLTWHEIPTRWDVDRPEDYWRLVSEMPLLAGDAAVRP